MSLYENIKCPVCDNVFADGDDVVTCPDCGTPHHRECYNELGKCANKNLHGTDFVFNREEESKTSMQAEIGDYYVEKNAGDVQAAEHTDAPEVMRNASAEDNDYRMPSQINIPNQLVFEKSGEEIDGVKVSDLMTVVSVNPFKFLPKFRKNKKLNWNWSAFIFGPYYFFFRKMYLQGTVIMALRYVCSLIVSAVYYTPLMSFMNNVISISDTEGMTLFKFIPEVWKLFGTHEGQQAGIAYLIVGSVTLVLHIISALMVDGIYRKKVINIVKTVDEKVEMGESFSVMGAMMETESNMNQSELRKLFLARRGGVSLLAPLFAITVMELFVNLIMKI